MNARFSPPPEEPDARAERAARRFAMLAELAETGMEISRRIRVELRALEQVETVEDLKIAPTSAQLGLAFDRVSRAMDRVLDLEARLDGDERTPRQTKAEAEAERLREAETGARVRRRLTHMFIKAGPGFESYVDGYEQPLPGEFDDEPESDDWKKDEAVLAAMAARDAASDAGIAAGPRADPEVERDVSVLGDEAGAADGAMIHSDAGAGAARPLHHPSDGPPPPMGEELGGSARRVIPPP